MKKGIIILFTGLLLLLAGCSEDAVTVEQSFEKEIIGKTISVKAGMPGENTSTRMALAQNDLDIDLTWEIGDVIHLVFSDGTTVVQQTTTVEAVSNQGRRAIFEITIPDEIANNSSTSTFDLYGVYGNVTFSEIDGEESYAVLSAGPWSGSLNDVQNNEVTLIRFAETNIDKNSPSISVNFQHVGSLFKIYLENQGTTELTGITGVELVSATTGTPLYGHQSATPGAATLNVISGEFVTGTTEFLEILPFNYVGNLAAGDVLELWGWYSPSQETEDIWPEINLRVNYGVSSEYATTNPKLAKTATTDIGKAYHFFARFNSDLNPTLAFTNIVNGSFMDERDEIIYRTVKIGNQVWMAENLRYYPGNPNTDIFTSADVGSATEPHYYVYGYDGVGTPDATVVFNYNNYGVLYNWPAAMAGAESSSANPSGVQGICPDGWHLPSEAEWLQLTDTYIGSLAAGKLKERGIEFWNESSGVTNEFGFSARGGGSRQAITSEPAGFYNLKINGHWITATEYSEANMKATWMQANSSTGGYHNAPKEYGGSIRCVKD